MEAHLHVYSVLDGIAWELRMRSEDFDGRFVRVQKGRLRSCGHSDDQDLHDVLEQAAAYTSSRGYDPNHS